MPNHILKFIWVLGILFGCAKTNTVQMGSTDSLAGLEKMANNKVFNKKLDQSVNKIREMSIKETALSLGAQSGLAQRAKIIDEKLTQQNRRLDAIYDFSALILENNVLPPVLLESRSTLNLADGQTIRISGRTYKIAKQAEFITTPPNWRAYLWMDYKQPHYPNLTLLPKNQEERKIWRHYVAKGWNNGIHQANSILDDSIARINEDFIGMILYRKLLAMNMVSPPYVSNTDLGVTGDSNEIHIDDRVLRITALPALNNNSDEWRAALSKDESKLTQLNNMEHDIQNRSLQITNQTWQPLISPIE